MESTPNPAIVIPTHKEEPTLEEKISLIQCQKVLGNFPIYLLHPLGMKIDAYKAIFPNLMYLSVSPELMGSISAYNKLMISPLIFKALQNYSHLLIHEPDAIVLKNSLIYWCEQGYDYIGAPWFLNEDVSDFRLKATGNFGLSLMNVNAANTIFQRNARWYTPSMILRDLLRCIRGRADLTRVFKAMGAEGKLTAASRLYTEHCDIFWSYMVPKINPKFKKAPPESAINFAWEKNPEKSFKKCNGEMPFGIHAWSKYNYEFLRPLFIEANVIMADTLRIKE